MTDHDPNLSFRANDDQVETRASAYLREVGHRLRIVRRQLGPSFTAAQVVAIDSHS